VNRKEIPFLVSRSADAVVSLVQQGLDKTQSAYNT
jgi:hypothetical protein